MFLFEILGPSRTNEFKKRHFDQTEINNELISDIDTYSNYQTKRNMDELKLPSIHKQYNSLSTIVDDDQVEKDGGNVKQVL